MHAATNSIPSKAFMRTLNDTTFNEYMRLFADAPQALRSQARRSWVALTVVQEGEAKDEDEDEDEDHQDVLGEVAEI